MNLADWNWKKIDDGVFREAEGATSGQSLSSLRSALRDVFRRMNNNMKLLENSVNISGRYIAAVGTFANGATTPDIMQASVWKTANTAGTVIVNFLGGEVGRQFTLIALDANTTIQNNANIVTKTGANRVLALGAVTQFVTTDGLVWREIPT